MVILKRLALIIIILAASGLSIFGQSGLERGQYLSIKNFAPNEYHGRPQNFDITEDNRGLLYFANTSGVLVYDGIFWRNIEVENGTVGSIDIDENGSVFVGGEDEFGFLRVNNLGVQEYVSLIDYLPDSIHSFGTIWSVHAGNEVVFYKADNYLFKWDGDTIVSWHTDQQFHTSFYINQKLFIRETSKGLLTLRNDTLELVENGEFFSNISIMEILPGNDSGLVIVSGRNGLFNYYPESHIGFPQIEIKNPMVDHFLKNNSITSASKLKENQIILGSEDKGVIILNTEINQYDLINYEAGLQDEVIYSMHVDQMGRLWMGLSNGISMSTLGSPVSSYGYNDGIKGSVEGICRYNDRLFITGINGALFLEKRLFDETLKNNHRFVNIKGINEDCFACCNFNNNGENFLLVATYSGVSSIHEDLTVEQVQKCYPWYIYQSSEYPSRILIGNEDGIESMYRNDSKWISEGRLDGIDDDCRAISEDHNGNIWIGTVGTGRLIKAIYPEPGSGVPPKVIVYDSTSNLPRGDIYVCAYQKDILAGTSEGLFAYDKEKDSFYPEKKFGKEFSDKSRGIHRISIDKEGFVWLVVYNNSSQEYETGYFKPSRDSTYEWINRPFLKFSKSVIHSIYHDSEDITWLGGPNGLFRYDRNIKKKYDVDYKSLIRKVTIKGDSVIFGGTFIDENGMPSLVQGKGNIPVIDFHFNSLTFNYSAPINDDESPLQFSYYLDGLDEGWKNWSQSYTNEYAKLHEGDYTFYVKAKNMYNHESEISSFSFIIKPPWYRTIPAIVAGVLLVIGILWMVIVFYTRGLRAIIRERTEEIRKQKEVIEERNKDIVDSIIYAKRIQSAMLTPGDYIDGLFPQRFVLYLPRDIVSGDFYWITKKNDKVICVTADCTGHGVPGAMMSMMGMSYLNEITSSEIDLHSDEIMNQLRSKIVTSLRQKGVEGEAQDGIDMALYILDFEKGILEFSGANLPLFILRNGELLVLKPDKMPIGISSKMDYPFRKEIWEYKEGDILYTFSDGFQDQFGGPKNKKFMIKRLRELLLKISAESLPQQKNILWESLENWMDESEAEQVDDVTIMAVKL